MNFTELRTFVQLTKVGSYSKTAEYLHLSQPTVSVHIKLLEKELRTKLFKKMRHRYSPTNDGLILLNYAQELLTIHDQCQAVFKRQYQSSNQTLKVAMTSLGATLLPQIAENFNIRFDSQYLTISINDTELVLKSLEDGVVDIAMAPLTNSQVTKYQQNNNVIPITTDELVLLASSKNPLSAEANITYDQLRSERFIIREHGSNTGELLQDWLGKHQIHPANSIQMSQHEVILHAINQNSGISLLPTRLLHEYKENVSILQLPDLPIYRTVYMVVPERIVNDRRVNYFIDFATNSFKNSTN